MGGFLSSCFTLPRPRPRPPPPLQQDHLTQPIMGSSGLPYASVDLSLRALAGKAEGFGRMAIGGLHGSLYRVVNLDGIVSCFFLCVCVFGDLLV